MRPESGAIEVDVNSEVKVVFNTRMNREETEKLVSILPETEVKFHWGMQDGYDIISFEPKTGWSKHSVYNIIIKEGAKDLSGAETKKSYKGEFTTK